MQSSCFSWFLIISLCIPSCATYGIGISIPTAAAAVVKAAGSIGAYYVTNTIDCINGKKPLKIAEKIETNRTRPVLVPEEITVEESMGPLIVTAVAFVSIVVFAIQMNKNLTKEKPATDKDKRCAQKA